jgi:hypothetical protein
MRGQLGEKGKKQHERNRRKKDAQSLDKEGISTDADSSTLK